MLATGAAVALSSCSSDDSPDSGSPDVATSDGPGSTSVCEVLTSDTATAATLFAPVIPGMHDLGYVQKRRALLDQVSEPPEDLATEWAVWSDYLAGAEGAIEQPTELLALQTDEVKAAGDELFDFYTDSCL